MILARLGGLAALMLVAATPALASDCAESFSTTAVDEQLDEAMLAFASLDEPGFLMAATKSAVMVPCVNAPLSPSLAAAYHRVHSVRFFVSGQETEALDSLRAAFGIDMDSRLSTRIAPEGGKLSRMQEEALDRPARRNSSLDAADGYKMMVDGASGSDVPSDAPHIVQLLDDGKLAWSGVLPPGGSLPAEYSADGRDLDPIELGDGGSGIADLDGPMDRTPERRQKPDRAGGGGPNGGLLAAGAGAGVAAVGLFGVAALTRGSFNKNPTAAKYHITNGTYWASVGFAGTAVVLGGASFLAGGK